MELLVGLYIAAHIVAALSLFVLTRSFNRLTRLWPLVVAAVGFRCLLVPAEPVFSDDIYRYIWDGRMLLQGENPYARPPDDPSYAELRDDNWKKINHRSMRTIYPPLAQIFFALNAAILAELWFFKLSAVVADVGLALLVVLAAKSHYTSYGLEPAERRHRAIFIGWVYALNPLACIETGLCGHFEAVAIGLSLLAIYLLERKAPLKAAAAAAGGALTKLAPLVLLPVIAQKRRVAVFVFILVVIGFYLPFLGAGWNTFETLDAYARRWEGNAGLFAILKWAAQGITGWIAGVSGDQAMLHIPVMDPLARALKDTFFSLHKEGGFDPGAPATFALIDIALVAAKIVSGLILLFVMFLGWKKPRSPISAANVLLGTLLLVSPQVHPWYVLWILPFAAILGSWPWFVFAALVPLSYLPLASWWTRGIWEAPAWIPWVEYGIFALAGIVYLVHKGVFKSRAQLFREEGRF